MCLIIDKKYRKHYKGKWVSRNLLQKATKNKFKLHSKGVQFVVHKYLFSRDSALKSRNKGNSNKYPYKKKRYYNTGWDSQSVKIEENAILLSKPTIMVKGVKRKQKPVKCFVKDPPSNIVQIELIHKDKPYLYVKYKEELEFNSINSSNHASIDLGEIHSITSIDSWGVSVIITGRKLRSLKYLRNKNQARIYKRMSRCEEGSRQYKKYLNALNNLRVKHEKQVKDCVHKISKLYLDFCLTNNISIVYYGDLDTISRYAKQNKKGNNVTRQKMNQWDFGKLTDQLENKLSRHGIKMVKVKEYYTSSKCPNCKKINKTKTRNYECSCGYEQHRDIVGAINILNDNTGTNLTHYQNKKYLRID